MTQKEVLEILKMGHNVYLTGSAGSGKTFLLNEYINFLKTNRVEVGITASTGIAATHMNGFTIHSWSGVGIKDNLSRNDLHAISKKQYLKKRFEKTKVLIIDEVSMLQAQFLDMIDQVCKFFKQDERPFGGMQVVLCGDFFQLPPINRNSEDINFIDKSEIWNNMDLKICYLEEQYRHSDENLTKILNDIRAGNTGEHTLKILRKRYRGEIAGAASPTKLYTHNIDVDKINYRELDNLPGSEKVYNMTSTKNLMLAEILKKSCLAPETLILKEGALVMFVKNNFNEGYVNGTLGRVDDFDEDGMPIIETLDGRKIVAQVANWVIEEEGKIKAEIKQLPLRLAWAITVHKSQGMTLDAAEIDLSKSFVEGMGYVALSRVRTLGGLRLLGLNKMALQVNEAVLNMDKELKNSSMNVIEELEMIDLAEKIKRKNEFLKTITPPEEKKSLSTHEETKFLVEQKMSFAEMAEQRNLTEGTIIFHIEKLLAQGENLDLEYLLEKIPAKRFKKIKAAFTRVNDTKLSPVRELLGDDFSYEELRIARLFLNIK